ncbi:MAG: 3-ketoacyl-ACP reductase [Porticoccaceae bacterium]|nr:3-ketoacyl-ACP reductase [Porticoccaceae bacterium]
MPTGLLENRIAVVTGAGRGIGRAVAILFAAQGAKVLIATRTESHGRETLDAIRRNGGTAELITVELGTLTAARAVIDAAVGHWGGLDIMVHNAAIIENCPLVDNPDDSFSRQFDIGMNTAFWLMKYGYSYLKQRGYGRVLLTSSLGAERTAHGFALYGAIKAGLEALARGAATEMGPDGITVNAVAPGGTRTASYERNMSDEFEKYWLSHIPLQRMGESEDIAQAMLYLASDNGSYVTGQTLTVDGGQSLPQAY